ncbi:MAG TPA: tyrosine--tRNA ligase [bacterium]|nr:tyrosine--tRNA ligase [bacterium]
MNFLDDMRWRGLVVDMTPGLEEHFQSQTVTGYIGFDPTAASLHVGSLMQIMNLARLQRAGHRPIAVVGGGTGMIGDPSGKANERPLLTVAQVEENAAAIHRQLQKFLDFDYGASRAIFVNNADWLNSLNFVAFLRDIGKHFSVNAMIGRESVRRRLESQEGISFTEFSYMLLQAYDFLMLHERHGCTLQMGGSDQWGNIVSGADLIRRIRGGQAFGLVSPLVTTASGTKFGKTEAGTVWLDASRTSPYKYYQFWLNTDDKDVVDYLKFFTWLDQKTIGELAEATRSRPEAREAQKVLAREVTRLTHGDDALARAEQVSKLFFSGELAELSAAELLDVLDDAPSSEIRRAEIDGNRLELAALLHQAGVATSKSDGKRSIEGGGIYLGGRKITDRDYAVSMSDSIEGKLFLLRKGKKQYHVVRITD